MKFVIHNRWTNKPLFEVEADTFIKAVESQKHNLSSANLSYADLSSANLRDANAQ